VRRWAAPLYKRQTCIGANPADNDVILPEAGPMCAQLIETTRKGVAGSQRTFCLVNVGTRQIAIGAAPRPESIDRLQPLESQPVGLGQLIRIGRYTLHLAEVEETSPSSSASNNGSSNGSKRFERRMATNFTMHAQLAPGDNTLRPDAPLYCQVDLCTTGDRPANIDVAVIGLPKQCIRQLVAKPWLPPTATARVTFEITHPCNDELAVGEVEFAVQASAPADYAYDQAMEPLTMIVAPWYAGDVGVHDSRTTRTP